MCHSDTSLGGLTEAVHHEVTHGTGVISVMPALHLPQHPCPRGVLPLPSDPLLFQRPLLYLSHMHQTPGQVRTITSSLQLLPLTPVRTSAFMSTYWPAMPHPEPSVAPYDFHDVFFPIFGPCDLYHLLLELLSSLLLNFRIICTYCGKFLASQEHTM